MSGSMVIRGKHYINRPEPGARRAAVYCTAADDASCLSGEWCQACIAIGADAEGTGPIPMEWRTGPIDVLIDGDHIVWRYSEPGPQ